MAEKLVVLTAYIKATDTLVNLEDDISPITIMIFSNRFEVLHKRYIKGYPDKTFRPSKSVTRAEVAAIFARILELESNIQHTSFYKDVANNFWAAEYIEAVTREELFKGDENGLFNPNAWMTRAEFAAVVSRYFKLERTDKLVPIKTYFEDTQGHWAENTINETYRQNIVQGYGDGSFNPRGELSRAEVVTMVNRLLFRGPLLNTKASFADMPLSHWASGHAEEAIRTHKWIVNADGTETMVEFIPEALW